MNNNILNNRQSSSMTTLRPIPFSANSIELDPTNDIKMQTNVNVTKELDNLNCQNIFSSQSPIPMDLKTPTTFLNQNDKIENLEQCFINTTTVINNNVPNDSRILSQSNIIEMDLTTTELSGDNSCNKSPSPTLTTANTENLEGDLEMLSTLRSKYTNNPSIGYLNINSLQSKNVHN